MQCNFHVLVGLSFISLFLRGLFSLLVARVLNTCESSSVVSIIQRFSEEEIALAPCYIFGQIVSVMARQDKYIKMH